MFFAILKNIYLLFEWIILKGSTSPKMYFKGTFGGVGGEKFV